MTGPLTPETIFTYGAPALSFGAGAAGEVGWSLAQRGARRVLVVTDAGVAAAGHPARIAEQIASAGLDVRIYDGVRVEPTDDSLREAAAAAAADGPWDAFVAVGGGSAIDTAKAVNLLLSCGGELMDYVNPPLGAGRAPTGPLRPLVAVPTTTGTGSESTTICVLDVVGMRVKTGISHPALRPTMAVVDPDLVMTQPAEVAACAGLDVLCHALESWTAKPYDRYERKRPEQRVPYCGANPVSDMFVERTLGLLGTSLRRAVHDPRDRRARADLALAATFAGLGFGNAGVHVPHANGYPVAGQVRTFRAAGYPDDHPMVPHGMSVALTAPETFRFTFPTDPGRHLAAARLLDRRSGSSAAGPDVLPGTLVRLMRDVGMPNGIAGVGYGPDDVPALVAGASAQTRLLANAPRPVTADDLERIFHRSLENW